MWLGIEVGSYSEMFVIKILRKEIPITDIYKYHYCESKTHNTTVTHVSDSPRSVSCSVQWKTGWRLGVGVGSYEWSSNGLCLLIFLFLSVLTLLNLLEGMSCFYHHSSVYFSPFPYWCNISPCCYNRTPFCQSAARQYYYQRFAVVEKFFNECKVTSDLLQQFLYNLRLLYTALKIPQFVQCDF